MGTYSAGDSYQTIPLPVNQEIAPKWFAVRVRSNCEKLASASLRARGYEELLPLCSDRRIWSDRIKVIETPLFPGYVFSKFNASIRLPILTTPGVVGIVGFGEDPAPVREQEIKSLRMMLNAGLTCEVWPYLEVGQPITINHGPLSGFDGEVLQIRGQYRLIVRISLLQRSVSAEIDRAEVSPIRRPETSFVMGAQRELPQRKVG